MTICRSARPKTLTVGSGRSCRTTIFVKEEILRCPAKTEVINYYKLLRKYSRAISLLKYNSVGKVGKLRRVRATIVAVEKQ